MFEFHAKVQRACATNDLNELSKLQVSREEFMSVDDQGNIALLIAAAAGNVPVIRMVASIGDKVLAYEAYKMFSARNQDGYNALSMAGRRGHVAAVIALYELGAYDI